MLPPSALFTVDSFPLFTFLSRIVASLTIVIYDRNMFIVQAAGTLLSDKDSEFEILLIFSRHRQNLFCVLNGMGWETIIKGEVK